MENIMQFIKSIPSMVEESKIVMLLIDGLGTTSLRLPKAFRKKTYRTVFPSSTPAFLYSFHSLLEPRTHGFLEWYMRFNKFGIIKIPPWETLSGEMLKIGTNVKENDVFPFKSLSEILWKKGLNSFYYSQFAETTFGKATSKKAENKRINYFSEIFPIPDANFTYIYLPSIDAILHKYYRNEKFKAELSSIEFQIRLLWKKLPRGRKLIILSDHGLTKVRKIYKLPRIGGIYPVGGSRIAFYKGVEKEKVERILDKALVKVLKLEEMEGFRERINGRCYENYGEVVVLAKNSVVFQYPFEEKVDLKGAHGGLSEEEYYINVWTARK